MERRIDRVIAAATDPGQIESLTPDKVDLPGVMRSQIASLQTVDEIESEAEPTTPLKSLAASQSGNVVTPAGTTLCEEDCLSDLSDHSYDFRNDAMKRRRSADADHSPKPDADGDESLPLRKSTRKLDTMRHTAGKEQPSKGQKHDTNGPVATRKCASRCHRNLPIIGTRLGLQHLLLSRTAPEKMAEGAAEGRTCSMPKYKTTETSQWFKPNKQWVCAACYYGAKRQERAAQVNADSLVVCPVVWRQRFDAGA